MRAISEARRPGQARWDSDVRDIWRSPTPAERQSLRAVGTLDGPASTEALQTVDDPGSSAARQALYNMALRVVLVIVVAITLLVAAMALVEWLRVRLDDIQYGRPRMSQMSGFVGHGETDGTPTTLVAVNLNRRITIIEIPGGDSSKIRTIAGPYLVGRDEDLTVATMRLVDVNADSHPDLLVRVKQEEVVFINDRGEFRLMTKTERPVVERALGGGQ